LRTECLNQDWFPTLADAAEKLEVWPECYDEERKHVAICDKVPVMLTENAGRLLPVTLVEAGKLCLRALQRRGSDQKDPIPYGIP
jgi:hypothetical protein